MTRTKKEIVGTFPVNIQPLKPRMSTKPSDELNAFHPVSTKDDYFPGVELKKFDGDGNVISEESEGAIQSSVDFQKIIDFMKTCMVFPYLPAVHHLQGRGFIPLYLFGPYDETWSEALLGDLVAGLTIDQVH